MNDDQFLDRVRLLLPAKRVAGWTMLILGIALSSGLAVWGQVQRTRVATMFDDLGARVRPTTAQAIDTVQVARDVSQFSIGFVVGMMFAMGLSLAFAGFVMLLSRRKDRLLLERDAALRKLARDD